MELGEDIYRCVSRERQASIRALFASMEYMTDEIDGVLCSLDNISHRENLDSESVKDVRDHLKAAREGLVKIAKSKYENSRACRDVLCDEPYYLKEA